MFDKYLVSICAPTLASLKSGSLFRCKFENPDDLSQWIETWNKEYKNYGLKLYVLKLCGDCALVYIYRSSQLKNTLSRPEIRDFLVSEGYPEALFQDSIDDRTLEILLEFLKSRIDSCQDFPHEIGVFLDYPLEDVLGFIENNGLNYKCSGMWKVYGDTEKAQVSFNKYAKCREVYSRLWKTGVRSILQMTVAG